MSLVDYASSDDDEEVEGQEDKQRLQPRAATLEESATTPRNEIPPKEVARSLPEEDFPHVQSESKRPTSSLNKQTVGTAARHSETSELKLPDASLLLNSLSTMPPLPHSSDHVSLVAAAMAESALRKRDLNGSASSHPRSKVPRGTLPHTKNMPDTLGGQFLPPQLAGRSNVVTEDIGKLFVKKQETPSSK